MTKYWTGVASCCKQTALGPEEMSTQERCLGMWLGARQSVHLIHWGGAHLWKVKNKVLECDWEHSSLTAYRNPRVNKIYECV